MVDSYMLYITLHKIKKIIDTEKFDNFKILIDTDDKSQLILIYKMLQ